MPSKKVNNLWEWLHDVDVNDIQLVHIQTVYRLLLGKCQKTCRINNKANPHCLCALGLGDWLSNPIDDDKLVSCVDPDKEARAEGSFVGLENLGETCYMNSLLQVCFHDVVFRMAVLQCELKSDEETQQKTKKKDSPETFLFYLQLLFAQLLLSKRRFIDPSFFVICLRVNPEVQQDAHEFLKLFINHIETELKNSSLADMISRRFYGEYAHGTRCSVCGVTSAFPSKFCELVMNVTDKKHLCECFQDYFKEEKLEGSNQYFCERCNSKVNAVRSIKLIKAPVVLNIQLVRYTFDKETTSKNKVTSSLDFPEVLDLNEYINESNSIYQLTAVLVHCGSETNEGHFLAHILDQSSGSWFTFNDDVVTKLEGTELTMPGESKAKKIKGQRLLKGNHRSNEVYMLVYRREDETINEDELRLDLDIPVKIRNLVNEDNEQFDASREKLFILKEKNQQDIKERTELVKKCSTIMSCDIGSSWNFLPTNWLKKWLKRNTKSIPPIDFEHYVCPHSKLKIDSVMSLKCISEEAASLLFNKYGGSRPLIGNESLCRDCVVAEAMNVLKKNKIIDDRKFIKKSNSLKLVNDQISYWVGKVSFDCWEALASQVKGIDACGDTIEHTTEDDKNGDKKDHGCHREISTDHIDAFNNEIVCVHGRLSANEACRRSVSSSVWTRLKAYFPSAPEFNEMEIPCIECQIGQALEETNLKFKCQVATEQKAKLGDLFAGKNRPLLEGRSVHTPTNIYVVTKTFIQKWRKFVRAPTSKDNQPKLIDNSELLCELHGRLIYSLSDTKNVDEMMVFIRDDEWKLLLEFYKVDVEICVTISPPKRSTKSSKVTSKPHLCTPCFEARLLEERKMLFQFGKAHITVIKIQSGEKDSFEAAHRGKSKIEDENHDEPKAKRKKGNPDVLDNTISSKESSNDVSLRRSCRRLKDQVNNEKRMSVMSTMTLKELKVDILDHFLAPPFDQHLKLDGVELVNDEKTLAELNFYRNCIIYLTVDEPTEDALNIKDTPEEGFKGTVFCG